MLRDMSINRTLSFATVMTYYFLLFSKMFIKRHNGFNS